MEQCISLLLSRPAATSGEKRVLKSLEADEKPLFLCSARTPEVPVLRLTLVMEMLLPKLIFFQHFLLYICSSNAVYSSAESWHFRNSWQNWTKGTPAGTLLADQGGPWLSSPARIMAGRRDPESPPGICTSRPRQGSVHWQRVPLPGHGPGAELLCRPAKAHQGALSSLILPERTISASSLPLL